MRIWERKEKIFYKMMKHKGWIWVAYKKKFIPFGDVKKEELKAKKFTNCHRNFLYVTKLQPLYELQQVLFEMKKHLRQSFSKCWNIAPHRVPRISSPEDPWGREEWSDFCTNSTRSGDKITKSGHSLPLRYSPSTSNSSSQQNQNESLETRISGKSNSKIYLQVILASRKALTLVNSAYY